MNAIFFAILGYFLIAIEAVVSKYLLSRSVKNWRVYVFYVGILSFFSIVFAPFGLQWNGFGTFGVSIFAGVVFFGHLAFLYRGLQQAQASQVYVLSGAVSTLGTFILARMLLGDTYSLAAIAGDLSLLVGGILVALQSQHMRLFPGWQGIVVAGVLLAISLVLLKDAYDRQNFISGYVYTRLGTTVTTALFFLIPSQRTVLSQSLRKNDRTKKTKQFGAVVVAKIIAGAGTFLVNTGIFSGSVAVVNALISVQYVFTFILSLAASFLMKQIFTEGRMKGDLIIKIIGVCLVASGVWLVYSF